MANVLNIPQSAPVNIKTGDWNPEWLLWIQSPSFLTIQTGTALAVNSGGTGLTNIPGAGQLLVGTGSGYTLSSTIPATALPAFTGDVTKPAGSAVQTLATVNANIGTFGSSTGVPSITVNGKGLITAVTGLAITGSPGSFAASGAFGANGATPQAAAVVNGAIAGTAGGVYTATEQGLINSLLALVNQLRAALVANGIAV